MADSAPETIICKFAAHADQWLAHFADTPQIAFGGDLPMRAFRRLLEGTEAAPDTYDLRCDADRVGSSVLHRSFVWDPPEVLFEYSACRGTGQYVGQVDVGACEVCGGRKVVTA